MKLTYILATVLFFSVIAFDSMAGVRIIIPTPAGQVWDNNQCMEKNKEGTWVECVHPNTDYSKRTCEDWTSPKTGDSGRWLSTQQGCVLDGYRYGPDAVPHSYWEVAI